MTRPAVYAVQAVSLTLALLVAFAGVNLAIDPYGIWSLWQRPGINCNKPGQRGHDRLVKAYALWRNPADALILGTSRMQYAVAASTPAIAARSEQPYNAALLGSNVYLALRYLQHAQALRPQKLVVLGLDPLMFNAIDADASRDFSERRLAVSATGEKQSRYNGEDLAATLLSMDALRLSVRTVRQQKTVVTDLLADGRRSPFVLARMFGNVGSLQANFAGVEREYYRDYKRAQLPQLAQLPGATPNPAAADSAQTAATVSPEAESLRHFRTLLQFVQEHGIRLEVFFTPSHVRLAAASLAADKMDMLYDWKRAVAAEVFAAQAKQAKDSSPINLWDMDVIDAHTSEPVPAADSANQQLRWFWEGTHMRSELADRIVAQMLRDGAVPDASMGVGTRVQPDNFESLVRAHREALRTWQQQNPQQAAQVLADVADAAKTAL